MWPNQWGTGGGGSSGGSNIVAQGRTYTAVGTPSPGGDSIVWLIIPNQAQWLKQFWDVQMTVTNLLEPGNGAAQAAAGVPDPYTLVNGTATLDLPAGLSLAALSAGAPAQALSEPMSDIAPTSQETASWIVRGESKARTTLPPSTPGR